MPPVETKTGFPVFPCSVSQESRVVATLCRCFEPPIVIPPVPASVGGQEAVGSTSGSVTTGAPSGLQFPFSFREHAAEVPMSNQPTPKLLMFVDDIYEDLELWYPKLRLIEAGAEVVVAGPKAGHKYAGKHGYPCVSDAALTDIQPETFSGLIIPGGFSPDKLRRDPLIKSLTRHFAQQGQLVAAICHGGWIPISAGVYRGVRVTGSPGIRDDLENAGAIFEDAAVVVDRHFVSSRKPDDLPDFCRGILQVLKAAGHGLQ